MSKRTFWRANDLSIADEPLALSLLKYRLHKDRQLDNTGNLVSSRTEDGRQMPIIDLDFPHKIIPSTHDGHSHLYLDVPISKFRWFVLMTALYYAGVIEMGFYVWSIRRGGNFVRSPYLSKRAGAESTYPSYGWFFRRKSG